MARHLDVVIAGNWSEFNGWQSRELYTQLFRRPAIFNTRTHRWVTVPDRAAELIAAAEHQGWTVTVQRVEQPDQHLHEHGDRVADEHGDRDQTWLFEDGDLR